MHINTNKQKIQTLLTRAVSNVIILDNLEKKLNSGKKLRIKFGIDPTAPDIHLGHAVPLIKLKQFQELGHQAVLIIGDFTAMIGDPAGRTEKRQSLKESEIKKNLKNYLAQAGKIIDIKKTEVHFNSEWFDKMKAADFYKLAGQMTIQQVLKREDFKKRIENGQDIVSTEMMYPLFQGYDSVMVRADVEIGGEDQLLNLLAGRKIQRAYNQPEQDILTTWIVEGTDGKRKMSKSYGNYIGVTERPSAMFGKIMSIPDSLIIKYFRALTTISDFDVDTFEVDIKSGEINPRDTKNRLSFEIVKMYHGENKANSARKEFEQVFKEQKLPDNIPITTLKAGEYNIVSLLVELKMVSSKSQARRLVIEKAVKIDGKTVNDLRADINVISDLVVQVGKRHFKKIKLK